jgi:hypothetical protein
MHGETIKLFIAQYSCILQHHRCTHKRDQWITQNLDAGLYTYVSLHEYQPPIVTVIHRTTAWCIVIIIPSLLNNYNKTSNKQPTKVYQLPGPIIISNGLYDVSVWKLQCRFNKKRYQWLFYIEFCKSRVVIMLSLDSEAGTECNTRSAFQLVSSGQQARLYT